MPPVIFQLFKITSNFSWPLRNVYLSLDLIIMPPENDENHGVYYYEHKRGYLS